MTQELESSRLLLVEGKDDKQFFDALKSELQYDDSIIHVIRYDGKTKLRKFLKALPGFLNFWRVDVLAVVRDADEIPENTIKSVRDALSTLFESIPNTHMTFEKSILKRESSGKKRVFSTAFVILPSGTRDGALEDLLLEAVQDGERMVCVAEFVKCLEGKGVIRPRMKAKTTLQAFLATHAKAENDLRVALRSDHIPASSETFADLRDFLKKMAAI